MPFTERQDQFQKASGFTVQITGAATSGPDATWKVCRGGSLRFEENAGTTTGHDQFKQHSLGMREWDDLVLIGPITETRKDMLKWYQDMVKGQDYRRNLTISVLGPDGQVTTTYNYSECFLTEYRLTELDSDNEAVCTEEVHICVGRSDNLLS